MIATQTVRIILTDDHDALLRSLSGMLAPRYDIAGLAHGGHELLALLRTTSADCLLLDLAMPGRSGIELLPEIRALAPRMRIVILTMHTHPSLVHAALRDGAHGFMPKDSGLAELAEAIDAVLAGNTWVSPRMAATA